MNDHDLRNRVARAIFNSLVDGHAGWDQCPDSHKDYLAAVDAALAEMGGVRKGPDWEGFGRDLLQDWPVGDVEGSELFEAALRNGLLREVPGGYDPEQHIDTECICPEKGDPWYEYAFGATIEPAPVSVREAALKAQIHRLTAAGDNLTAWVDDRGTPDVRKWDKARDEAFRAIAEGKDDE